MWLNHVPLIILIFADHCVAETLKTVRQPQIISTQNFTRSRSRSSVKPEIINAYQPTWESLDTRPLPQWYDDAKVGEIIILRNFCARLKLRNSRNFHSFRRLLVDKLRLRVVLDQLEELKDSIVRRVYEQNAKAGLHLSSEQTDD